MAWEERMINYDIAHEIIMRLLDFFVLDFDLVQSVELLEMFIIYYFFLSKSLYFK